jgi:hypothetical protein
MGEIKPWVVAHVPTTFVRSLDKDQVAVYRAARLLSAQF